MNETNENKTNKPLQGDGLADQDRREALKKLGKYAAYTAPVMLMLLLPKKCLALSDCEIDPEGCRD